MKFSKKNIFRVLSLGAIIAFTVLFRVEIRDADAGLVSKPYTFTNSAVADATQVNSDFDTLYSLVNGSLDSANLAANSVGTSEIQSDSVNFTKIDWGTGSNQIRGTETTSWRLGQGLANYFDIARPSLTGDRTWTLQDSSDTFVGRATTDTLTNKTLTAPILSGTVTGTYTMGGTPSITSPTITGTPTAASATWTNLGSVTTADINGGTIDGTTIGASSATTGVFTTVDTGQGANELYDMDQNVLTTSSTVFNDINVHWVSQNGDAADSGFIEMQNNAAIAWEASPAGTDITLAVNSSGVMTTNGAFSTTGDLTVDGVFNLGTGGVVLSDDGDGALTITGSGNGSDEDLTINLDDTANTAVVSSSTGVTSVNFTGMTMNLNNSGDLNIYSDSGSNVRVSISGSTGKVIGAPQKVGTYNLELVRATTTNAGDSLKVQCGGASCSATNPGYVVMNGTTAGTLTTFRVTSDITQLLTGTLWSLDPGDVTGALIRALFVNDNGTLRTCYAYLGGRQTLLTTDTNATQASIDLPEEVLCNTAVSSSTNTVLEWAFARADFDTTGGAAENLWAVQSGINDVVTGKTADGLCQPWNPTEVSGWSGTPTFGASNKFCQTGRTITIQYFAANGVSDATTAEFNGPTKARASTLAGFINYIDNGGITYSNIVGNSITYVGETRIGFSPSQNLGASGWTSSNNKIINTNSISYEVGPAASFID